jgi:hypothetical protein
MTSKHERPQVSSTALQEAIRFVISELNRRLEEKGHGAFVSRHELYGVLDEEVQELRAAVHDNMPNPDMIAELADVAVPAIFGIACIKEDAMDW